MKANAIALTLAVILAPGVRAQRPTVPVRGVIFDSLRGKPIPNASVSIAGRTQVMTTDAQGRFQFDSVEPGVHRIVAQHPILDSIGLSGLSARAMVAAGTNEVRLAVPSFATLWRTVCRGSAPKDSGIVYGTIRDATLGTPVANAAVDVSWSDLVLDDRHRLRERKWRIETRSNAEGDYAACGVAPDLTFELHAEASGRQSGRIGFPAPTTRVQRHDLLIAATASESNAGLGTVAGTVTDPAGLPVGDARVIVDELAEVRTRDDGTFTVSNVPAGTRRIEVRAIGTAASGIAVDVVPGKVSDIAVSVNPIRTLAPIETKAERNLRLFKTEFNERRRLGLGYIRDSTDIARYDQFLNVLRAVPSMVVQYRTPSLRISVPDGVGGQCAPRAIIDGAEGQFGHLIDLDPKEIAALEVYIRGSQVPQRYAPAGIQAQCGAILVWTKYGMRNR